MKVTSIPFLMDYNVISYLKDEDHTLAEDVYRDIFNMGIEYIDNGTYMEDTIVNKIYSYILQEVAMRTHIVDYSKLSHDCFTVLNIFMDYYTKANISISNIKRVEIISNVLMIYHK